MELYTSHGSQLEISMVRLSHQCPAPRALAQLYPAGNQMVLGKHDGRNGGRAGRGPGAVPPHAHYAPEGRDPRYPYDSFPSVEVLEEGAKAFGWDKRNPVAGGAPGRFKRGFGLGMSQHHGGLMGYHEGEEAFAKLAAAPGAAVFGTELELGADGYVTMNVALPDSGSNAATALAHLVAEMLGFTTRDRIRLLWGDTDISPSSDEWFGGRTITLQGAAICNAADKLRKDLLTRAASVSCRSTRQSFRFAMA